jgi:hypothetical protein
MLCVKRERERVKWHNVYYFGNIRVKSFFKRKNDNNKKNLNK